MRRDSGQVAVEAALVMPIWLLMAVGAVQLAMLQQARLMTEYAAYSAARAGIVWNGNNERMRDAALLSLLPTIGGAASMEELGTTWQRARILDSLFHDQLAPTAQVPAAFKASGLLGLVRVDVLSPRSTGEAAELAFDAAGTRTEADAQRSARATHGAVAPERAAPLLTIRVRHWFELRLPFANQILFHAWSAIAAGPTESPGLPNLSASERQFLAALAEGAGPLGNSKRYFIPLSATWSMPMQSEFHRKWLMHPEEVP